MDTKYEEKKIAIIGLGYVGLPLALLADRKGYRVIGIDRDVERVKQINNKISPFKDAEVSHFLKKSNIKATTRFQMILGCSTVIVCVPTPVDAHHKPDLNPVKDAILQIAKYLQKGQLVILESTVNPGVCEEIIKPTLEMISGLKVGKDFHLSHCPERINPGDKNWNVENIPRVVGSLESVGLKKTISFYRSIITADIHPMENIKETEAVKIVENAFRDINIAFVNELAESFYKLGIDAVNVIHGAATKPFSFLAHYPSCGVGGHCIPVDPYYLIDYAKKNGYTHRFLSLARRINNHMPIFTVSLLEKILRNKNEMLKGSKVTVLGLAYKGNISDCRESPALKIIKELEKKGSVVSTYDPFVKNKSTAHTLQEAMKDSKAVIIATAHNRFKHLTPSFFEKYHVPIVVDGQNILSKKKFLNSKITYQGIGIQNKYA